jgi:hypothetical protein
MDLNIPTLTSWMTQGVVDAIIIFFMAYAVIGFSADGLYIFGTTCYSCLLLAMMYRAASSTYSWNFISFFFWFGSLILYGGIFLPIYSNWYDYAPQFYGVAAMMASNPTFWLIMFIVPTSVLLLDLAKKLFRSMKFASPIDHAMEIDRGITWNVKEMMDVYQNDPAAIKRLMKNRGATDDEGMYKWWMAFNDRLPKFKFDKAKLQAMNRHLDAKSKKDLGIVDTEADRNAVSGFAFDHIGRDIGVGGRGSITSDPRQNSDERNRSDFHSSGGASSGGTKVSHGDHASDRELSGDRPELRGNGLSVRNLGLGEKTSI